MRKFRIKISAEKKKHLISFSIFFGIVFGLTVILVIFTLLSRNSWKAGLAGEMQRVLDLSHMEQYTVGQNLPVSSTLSTSSAVYSLIKKDNRLNEKYYGVMIRVPSILGPLPAVFIYNEKSGAVFVDYAIDNAKAASAVSIKIDTNVIKYWEDMIPKIISKTEG